MTSGFLYSITSLKPILEQVGYAVPLYSCPLYLDMECYMTIVFVPSMERTDVLKKEPVRIGYVMDALRDYRVLSYQWLNACNYGGVPVG